MNISQIPITDSQATNKQSSPPPTKLHKKPIFPSKTKWRCLTSSDLINIKKHERKMLSMIQLNFLGLKDVENSDLRNIHRALTDNMRSSSLIIKRHYHWYSQHTKKIDRLFITTNPWKSLKFYYNDLQAMPTKEDLKSLTSLRKYKNLSNFEIILNCDEPNKNTILSMLQKQLKSIKNLKNFTIDINQCDRAESLKRTDKHYDENATTLSFKFPTSLSSLEIVLGDGDLKTKMLSKLAKNIPTSLQHLNLDIFSLYHKLEILEGKTWASLFEKLQNLKTLTLTTQWQKNISHEGAQIFLEGLQHLKQLTSLNFNFFFPTNSGCSTEIFLHDLFRHLSSLPNLNTLNLQYESFQTPEDSAFPTFFSHPKHLPQLQQLSFSCSLNWGLNDTFLSQLAAALQYLQNLQKFHLCLAASYFSDTGIASLGESLKKLLHIKDLNLDFDRCNLHEKSLQTLSENIGHLNLTSFKLIIHRQNKPKSFLERLVTSWKEPKEPKDQEGFASFCFTLERFTLLSTLSLNLSSFQINTKEFKRFSDAFKGLKNLTSLSLELPQYTSGDNFEGFTSFALALRDLTELKLLHLTALRGAKLSDQEVIFLYLNVKACRFLKDLKLCFEQVDLTDECLPSICIGVQDLLDLKHFNISFGEEQKFKKEKVLELLENFAVLKKLKTLEFRYSRFIGPEFGDLCKTKIKYLQSFVFNGYHYQTLHF